MGDTTGVAATFNKISSVGKACKYGLSTNTPADSTYLEMKYQESAPKRYPAAFNNPTQMVYTSTRKFLVKITRRTFNPSANRWVTNTVNLTGEYESDQSVVTNTHLKDLVAYAANQTLVTANFAKIIAQEA